MPESSSYEMSTYWGSLRYREVRSSGEVILSGPGGSIWGWGEDGVLTEHLSWRPLHFPRVNVINATPPRITAIATRSLRPTASPARPAPISTATGGLT